MKPFAHDLRPQTPRRAELRNLFQQVAVRVEKERQLRRKLVDSQPRMERRLNIRNPIRQGKRYFLNRRGTCLANVVSGNGNGVPLGQLVADPRKNISDD